MAEFDEKLNTLLSDPHAMDQIMRMARSLMGGEASGSPPADGGSGSISGNRAATPPSGTPGQPPFPPFTPPPGQTGWNPPQEPSPTPFWNVPPGNGTQGGQSHGDAGSDLNFLSGLGTIDPKTIAALLPILRELTSSQNSNARQLLFALRPYLKPERQDKVERALQLARLFRVGKKFLLKGDDHV